MLRTSQLPTDSGAWIWFSVDLQWRAVVSHDTPLHFPHTLLTVLRVMEVALVPKEAVLHTLSHG